MEKPRHSKQCIARLNRAIVNEASYRAAEYTASDHTEKAKMHAERWRWVNKIRCTCTTGPQVKETTA